MPVLALALALIAALVVPASADAAKRSLYVSLGDSYAAGYQPDKGYTRKGFPYLVRKAARDRGHRFKVVNFACGGETTTSIRERKAACAGRAPGGPNYKGRTQAAAAERFLRRNRKRVRLITVSIGGNDVTSCARGVGDPVPCVLAAIEDMKTNVRALVKRLRKAAGRKARIVGVTYPDVILGEWLGGEPADRELAGLSVVAFRDLINPALKEQYESVRGTFVDVTEATGAYGSLDELVTLEPYGVIPKPVARVCELTWYCEAGDIHARTKGYRLIAELIADTLPRRRR